MHNPITTIIQSTGRVSIYSLCVDSILLTSIPTTWMAFRMGASSEVCVVLMICVCLIAHIARLIILHRLYQQFQYIPYLLRIILSGIIITLLTGVVAETVHNAMPPGIIRIIAVSAVSVTVMLLTIYFIGLSKEERQIIQGFMMKRLRKVEQIIH